MTRQVREAMSTQSDNMNILYSALLGLVFGLGTLTVQNIQHRLAGPIFGTTPVSVTTQGGTGTSTPSGILYGDNGATPRLSTLTIGSNLTLTGSTLSATGGGTSGIATTSVLGTWPIIRTLTTAAITFSWGGLSTTTQPASSNLLTSNGTNGVYGTATSTGTVSSPLTGNFICVGSGCTLGIQAASASQAGSMAAVDWQLLHTATTTFSGALVYTLATNAVTCTTATASVPGCLAAADFTTFNAKLGGYDAFTHPSNFSTTTSATTTSIWTAGVFFSTSTTAASQFPYASTTAFSVSGNSFLGTVSTGVWNGTAISTQFGGTGRSNPGSPAAGTFLEYDGSNGTSVISAGAQYTVLQSTAAGSGFTADAVHLDQSAAVTGILPVLNGGTGSSTLATGELLYGSATGGVRATATTSASCSGSVSCSSFTVIGPSPITITGSAGASSVGTVATSATDTFGQIPWYDTTNGFPAKLFDANYFTIATSGATVSLNIGKPATSNDAGQLVLSYAGSVTDSTLTLTPGAASNGAHTVTIPNLTGVLCLTSTCAPFNFGTLTFSTTTIATTTSIWLNGGSFFSSSTVASQLPYASTTMLTAANASTSVLTVSGVVSALHLASATGLVSAYAGSAPCTNQVALSLSALGVITCTSVTNAMLSNSVSNFTFTGNVSGGASVALGASENITVPFEWTPTTNFSVNTTATSTPVFLKNNIFASSSAAIPSWIDWLNIGSTTAGNMATSTFFDNVNIVGNASTSKLVVSNITGCVQASAIGVFTGTGSSCTGTGVFAWTPGTTFATAGNATGTKISLLGGLEASSTVRFGTAGILGQFTWVGATGFLGLSSSTPTRTLSVGSGTASSSISVAEYAFGKTGNIATSTAMTIGPDVSSKILWPIGFAATTLTLCNFQPGEQILVKVQNPNQAAGALTWATCSGQKLYWPTGTITQPAQTTTANHWDMWSFVANSPTGTTTAATIISGTQIAF